MRTHPVEIRFTNRTLAEALQSAAGYFDVFPEDAGPCRVELRFDDTKVDLGFVFRDVDEDDTVCITEI